MAWRVAVFPVGAPAYVRPGPLAGAALTEVFGADALLDRWTAGCTTVVYDLRAAPHTSNVNALWRDCALPFHGPVLVEAPLAQPPDDAALLDAARAALTGPDVPLAAEVDALVCADDACFERQYDIRGVLQHFNGRRQRRSAVAMQAAQIADALPRPPAARRPRDRPFQAPDAYFYRACAPKPRRRPHRDADAQAHAPGTKDPNACWRVQHSDAIARRAEARCL